MSRLRTNKWLIWMVLLAVMLFTAAWTFADHLEVKNGSAWLAGQGDSNGYLMVGGVQNLQIFTSQAYTATTGSSQTANRNFRGVLLYLNVTAVSGTSPTLTVQLQGKDPSSGNWFAVAAATSAVTAMGQYVYVFYPGATTGSATLGVSTVLPANWRVNAVIGGTSPSFTFTVTADLLI